MRQKFLLTLLFCFLIGSPVRESHAEFFGTPETGLLEIREKHSVYLFVPPDYSQERDWPILFLLPARGEDPKEVIGLWVDWAKQNKLLVSALPNLLTDRGVPDEVDRWVFKVKRRIQERYRIDRSQIFLVGFGSGAHYTAYLGLKYPKEFSGAALIQEAWPGPLEKLVKPTSNPRKQIPFYLAMDPKGDSFPAVKAKMKNLTEKGYRVTLQILGRDQSFLESRNRMMEWFRSIK